VVGVPVAQVFDPRVLHLEPPEHFLLVRTILLSEVQKQDVLNFLRSL